MLVPSLKYVHSPEKRASVCLENISLRTCSDNACDKLIASLEDGLNPTFAMSRSYKGFPQYHLSLAIDFGGKRRAYSFLEVSDRAGDAIAAAPTCTWLPDTPVRRGLTCWRGSKESDE